MHEDNAALCERTEEVVLPAFLASAVNSPVRERCWQTAGMSQRLSIITPPQLAPICHTQAERHLTRASELCGAGGDAASQASLCQTFLYKLLSDTSSEFGYLV